MCPPMGDKARLEVTIIHLRFHCELLSFGLWLPCTPLPTCPPGHQPSHLTRPHHPPLAGSTSARVAFSPLPSAKPMKRVDTVELDFITCTTIIPPRAWGTGEYTPPPAKAVSMVFGVHGGHVATCQSGSRFVRRLSFDLLLLFETPAWPTGSCRV